MQFYWPKNNAIFALFLDIKPFFTMKKKAPFQMTYIIGKVWLRQRFCLVLGSLHISILAIDFFQRSGHYMVPISCKAS